MTFRVYAQDYERFLGIANEACDLRGGNWVRLLPQSSTAPTGSSCGSRAPTTISFSPKTHPDPT